MGRGLLEATDPASVATAEPTAQQARLGQRLGGRRWRKVEEGGGWKCEVPRNADGMHLLQMLRLQGGAWCMIDEQGNILEARHLSK